MSVIIMWEKAPKLSGPCPCTRFTKITPFSVTAFCIKLKIKVTVELLNKHKTSLSLQAEIAKGVVCGKEPPVTIMLFHVLEQSCSVYSPLHPTHFPIWVKSCVWPSMGRPYLHDWFGEALRTSSHGSLEVKQQSEVASRLLASPKVTWSKE